MKEDIHKQVRSTYGEIARQGGCGCGIGCCNTGKTVESVSLDLGYSESDLEAVPEGANLGLGCGNPVALASLREGEVVLDLGSGAGFRLFPCCGAGRPDRSCHRCRYDARYA